MLKLAITYIWLTLSIPRDYILQFEKAKYPVEVLLNPIKATSEVEFEKAAIHYKLSTLKNGGVYVDFTTSLHYDQLMKRLSRFEGEMWVAEESGKGKWNFIYVPTNSTRIIGEMIQEMQQVCTGNVSCKEADLFQKFKHRIKFNELEDCLGRNLGIEQQMQPHLVVALALMSPFIGFVVIFGCFKLLRRNGQENMSVTSESSFQK